MSGVALFAGLIAGPVVVPLAYWAIWKFWFRYGEQ